MRATKRAYLRTWHAIVRHNLYMHNAMQTCIVAKRMATRRAVAAAWKRFVWCLRTCDKAAVRSAKRLLKRAWTHACEYGECVCVGLCTILEGVMQHDAHLLKPSS
jgi:hypothetical protein